MSFIEKVRHFIKTHISPLFHKSDFILTIRFKDEFFYLSPFCRAYNAIGIIGEKIAAQALEHMGCIIIEKNWKVRHGEIDIIAYRHKSLIFCEVKTRKLCHQERYPALSAINQKKQKQIEKLASLYIRKYSRRLKGVCIKSRRFDIIIVSYRGVPWAGLAHVRHYKNSVDSKMKSDAWNTKRI